MRLRRHSLLATAFVAVLTAWIVADAFTSGQLGLLYVAPALVLVLPLLFGRYLGEERIVALAGHATPATPRRCPRTLPARRVVDRPAHRGGRLLARSLAKRPPPRRAPSLAL